MKEFNETNPSRRSRFDVLNIFHPDVNSHDEVTNSVITTPTKQFFINSTRALEALHLFHSNQSHF